MQATARRDANAILVENKSLEAAQCKICGGKIYPASLLKPHLTRHRRRTRWYKSELRKLQHTMAHMRAFA
jgi:hypothetical protein